MYLFSTRAIARVLFCGKPETMPLKNQYKVLSLQHSTHLKIYYIYETIV